MIATISSTFPQRISKQSLKQSLKQFPKEFLKEFVRRCLKEFLRIFLKESRKRSLKDREDPEACDAPDQSYRIIGLYAEGCRSKLLNNWKHLAQLFNSFDREHLMPPDPPEDPGDPPGDPSKIAEPP